MSERFERQYTRRFPRKALRLMWREVNQLVAATFADV